MKMKFLIWILLALYVIGCGTTELVVSEFGDSAEITANDGSNINCEILFFTDSTVVFSLRAVNVTDYRILSKTLYFLYIDEIKSITIQGYDGSGWKTSVIIGQFIPAVLMGIAAASVDANYIAVTAICSIPAILTSLFFLSSEGETPYWNKNNTENKMSNLNIYCRYPNGLSSQEIELLLRKHNQKEIIKYNDQ